MLAPNGLQSVVDCTCAKCGIDTDDFKLMSLYHSRYEGLCIECFSDWVDFSRFTLNSDEEIMDFIRFISN